MKKNGLSNVGNLRHHRALGFLFLIAFSSWAPCTVGQISPVVVTNLPLPNGAASLYVSSNLLYTVGSGFRIFDISNPTNPLPISNVALAGGGSGMGLLGGHAFVLNGYPNASEGEVDVYDVSDPANPAVVGHISGYWYNVAACGTNAFLTGDTGISGYPVAIYNVTDPGKPVPAGRISVPAPNSIVTTSAYAYMAVNPGGLYICNVSDPANPVTIGNAPNGLTFDLAVQGDFTYLVGFTNGLIVCNQSDPTNPVVISHVVPLATGVAVSGNFAFVAAGYDFTAFDVSNPTNPITVFHNPGYGGSYLTPHQMAVSRGYVYVANSQSVSIYNLRITPPLLRINNTNNTVVLSWPTPSSAFLAQQSPNLASWTTLTNMPTVVGSQNQISVAGSTVPTFYRLVSQ